MYPAFHFDNSYLQLPHDFYKLLSPKEVKAPELLLFNEALADQLGIAYRHSSKEELAAIFSGNVLPEGAEPLAQAYAGHQFGHFTMLGDGRAILLGEHLDHQHHRHDIQLKGSGRTPFSRGGDGRATLSAMLREYLISEAIHTLGIPGSRSLAVVLTGEPVNRDRVHRGAVLTRLMDSHIRVGTFEYARQYLPEKALENLLDYAVNRHYPHLADSSQKALDFIEAVMAKHISLVSDWMRVGFIHGVMNTDNMHIGGQTFDFGPCAFMNAYDPLTVFSSIDHAGRYAFGKQATMAQWNLGALGGALLPLIHPNTDQAIEQARDLLNTFPDRFREAWAATLAAKLGFTAATDEDRNLGDTLLNWMKQSQADYTNTFCFLMGEANLPEAALYQREDFQKWYKQWLQRIETHEGGLLAARTRMQRQNPRIIPRNHLVEEALSEAAEHDNLAPFKQLLEAMTHAYDDLPIAASFREAPAGGDADYQTFCGT